MKITFVLPVIQPNGGCRVIAIYARKLIDMGHDVTIVSRLPAQRSNARKLADLIRGREPPLDEAHRLSHMIDLKDHLVEIPYKFPLEASDVPDADVVIGTWWRTAFEVAVLPPEKGTKVYFIQHHEVHPHLPWDLAAGSYYLPLKKITIADWLVETMAKRYGDTDVTKVENSVDTDQFDAPPRRRNAAPTIGLLYSNASFKGIAVSLKAIEIARAAFPNLKVVAFGASDPNRTHPLPDGAEFHKLPAQNKLREIYAKCDVWLCGSWEEGFHLPPLEAMACRCPVVGTRVGGVVETVTDGISGYTVETGDFEALGARLTDVLSLPPHEWHAMSDAAYTRAHAYTWDDAARRFESALRVIVDQQ